MVKILRFLAEASKKLPLEHSPLGPVLRPQGRREERCVPRENSDGGGNDGNSFKRKRNVMMGQERVKEAHRGEERSPCGKGIAGAWGASGAPLGGPLRP